jgi:hypothetical protein
MSEPVRCMNHIESGEGDFFCKLSHGHDGDHEDTQQAVESVDDVEGQPFTSKTFRVTWGR